jgi:hypothetical protein
VLWSHEAQDQQAMMFGPDSEAVQRVGRDAAEQELIDRKSTAIWQSASHCHVNRDFRFNSQSTTMQFTPNVAIGGRAWPSLSLASVDREKAMVVWANTTFGILLYWWHANRQQAGRGTIGVLAISSLPVWDVTAATEEQLQACTALFDTFSTRALRPIDELSSDSVRRELDERFAREVLHLPDEITAQTGSLDLLRNKLCAEPSIRG